MRPAKHQVDDLLGEVRKRIEKQERVLITTLTKRSAEDLTDYYQGLGLKVKYLHSDIKTVERTEIIRDLRLGVFDVLIGINLLREGLDIPEVSLVAVTDADKEGFLRSTRSLIQTIGRAARNADGHVILYADNITDSMKNAMEETDRRRKKQLDYNKEHGITPKTIKKKVKEGLLEIYGETMPSAPLPGVSKSDLKAMEAKTKYKGTPEQLRKEIERLKEKKNKAAQNLDFEEAANLRDEIRRLEMIQLAQLSGSIE